MYDLAENRQLDIRTGVTDGHRRFNSLNFRQKYSPIIRIMSERYNAVLAGYSLMTEAFRPPAGDGAFVADESGLRPPPSCVAIHVVRAMVVLRYRPNNELKPKPRFHLLDFKTLGIAIGCQIQRSLVGWQNILLTTPSSTSSLQILCDYILCIGFER